MSLACFRNWIVVFVLALFSLGSVAFAQSPEEDAQKPLTVANQLREMIEPFVSSGGGAAPVLQMEGLQVQLHKDLISFYRQRGYRPAWFHDGRVTPVAQQWIARVQGVAAEGLRPADYHVATLATCLELAHLSQSYGVQCDPTGLALLDLLLSDSFLKFVSHLINGRVDPVQLYAAEWQSAVSAIDAVGVLHQVLRKGEVAAVLEEILPYRAGYQRLAVYLAHYRQLALGGGWPVLADGPPVRPGDRDARLPALRRFLVLVGDLESSRQSSGWRMDAVTVAALKRFQVRHGLRADGVLGKDTLAQINVPVGRRIEQLGLNLERERWPKQDAGDRYLQVDITDFTLTLVDGGREIMRMPVVVGTSFRRTPVFSALMTYLVFAPYWTVPPTILEQDKLPVIKANPDYLDSHHYEIVAWGKDPNRTIDAASIDWKTITAKSFPGMLRQKPGPWNPLGKVKFMFPNAYHVYLHDTPAQYLFAKQQRTFSSGCIRIARPLELAIYLLDGQKGWDSERIKKEMAASKPYTVRLKNPIPVHILYRTAWVDVQGRLQFRNDVYERDQELQAALKQRPESSGQMAEVTMQVGGEAADRPSESESGLVR
ncbi:peptidoglycan transpeptidase YkuD [Syntrophotalea carbinolica DSM 2380]|uniref:Peptidoglycan transpeptidase YkuD n=1 Tax=Syntrophotalea carbinolica (strain DSM 2380 / NBRC 103641 / GraBd1) TaxID=338963 RepID=Q3A5N2_SYNC1|nr:peptidoglycan transpeptidase YkuD [Syntrophotalea carbinolica DSM 2380]